MPETLPLQPSIPFYSVGTTLSGLPFVLNMRWNGRDSAWYMDILTVDETPIAHGLKLVLGAIVSRRVVSESMPPGVFTVNDLSGAGREATLDDMGTRVIVNYHDSLGGFSG